MFLFAALFILMLCVCLDGWRHDCGGAGDGGGDSLFVQGGGSCREVVAQLQHMLVGSA